MTEKKTLSSLIYSS